MSYIDVPGHPGIRVEAFPDSKGARLFYTGEVAQLIAARIVPAEALVRWQPGMKKGRVDHDGDRANVELYYGSTGGVPTPRARVILFKPLDRALRMPGACDAWTIVQREAAELAERNRLWQDEERAREARCLIPPSSDLELRRLH